MGQHVLLEIALSGETPVTGRANKWAFFGMASIVNVQGTLTSKSLPTDVTGRVLAGASLAEWKYHAKRLFRGIDRCQVQGSYVGGVRVQEAYTGVLKG